LDLGVALCLIWLCFELAGTFLGNGLYRFSSDWILFVSAWIGFRLYQLGLVFVCLSLSMDWILDYMIERLDWILGFDQSILPEICCSLADRAYIEYTVFI
jgi:putative Mn2+ efflux pump MntP